MTDFANPLGMTAVERNAKRLAPARPDAGSFVTPMAEIARDAGALLMSYFLHVTVEYKGEADLVTEADRASETLIRQRIRKLWPTHDILGEEEGLIDTGSDYRWYVDPLDGTTNFAHGFPMFCVSMALEHKGHTHCRSDLRSHSG